MGVNNAITSPMGECRQTDRQQQEEISGRRRLCPPPPSVPPTKKTILYQVSYANGAGIVRRRTMCAANNGREGIYRLRGHYRLEDSFTRGPARVVARQEGHLSAMARTRVCDTVLDTISIVQFKLPLQVTCHVAWLTHAISRKILPCLILVPAQHAKGQFFNSIPLHCTLDPSLHWSSPTLHRTLSLTHPLALPLPLSLPISQYRLKSLCAAHTFVQSKHSRGIEAEGANSNGYFLLHVRVRVRVHLPPPPPMFDQQYNGGSGWVISVHPAFWGEGEVRAIKSPTLREKYTWVGDKKRNSPADRFISAE